MALIYRFWCFWVLLLFLPMPALSSGKQQAAASEPHIEIGRRIYQQGIRPNGEPVSAIVLGTVEISGIQFTCLNCHRRSGLGGPEGAKYVLPINGPSLLTPRSDIYLPRPAYTEQSFAASLRSGRNPNGEAFDPIMPRYKLPDREMSALFGYLKSLSSVFSPGLTDEELHVATIVSDAVPQQQRQAMLSVIETFFANKNAETRREKKRYDSGPFYQEYRNKAYRRWHLHIWELTGPAAGWPQQLERYYRQQPVFVILSGLVKGSWEPIHRFSKEHRVPSILPNTKLPVVEPRNDFYTLYYSPGVYLEAEVIAEQLKQGPETARVLQVFRPETAGAAAGDFLRRISVGKDLRDVVLSGGSHDWSLLRDSVREIAPDRLVLWLAAADLEKFAAEVPFTGPVYLSSSLLDGQPQRVPDGLTSSTQLVHPFNLPQDHRARFLRVSAWMKVNDIPLTNPLLQGQSYYACMLLNAGLKHMKRFFYREFFLDLLDHGERMAAYSGNYPRLSFGPEQRFLAKGAYLIDLQRGDAKWIVPDF